ncbi:MAG: C69 family dipeptidase [Bacteroidales bacterium]
MCTTIVVGRKRSATGRVLLAHNEDLGRNSAHKISVVEAREPGPDERFAVYSGGSLDQPASAARYLAARIFDKRHFPGDHTSGINEHGVAVANNMATMRGVPAEHQFDVLPGGIIWTEFMQLVLERAASAREGVALVSDLCERRGLSCDSGTMIAIADPDEAWWVELARDGKWAAQRVGDDEVSIRANCYRIPDFATAYGDPATQADRYNLDRHETLEARVAAMPALGVPELMALLRDLYEGTPLYRTREDGSPFKTDVRTVAILRTEAATILEGQPDLPQGLGHRMWCCLSTPLTGVFVPFHVGVQRIEAHYATADGTYSPGSAYWLFSELARLVDYRYRSCAALVRGAWRDVEAETLRELAAAEDRCRGLAAAQCSDLLTDFDNQRAAAAIRKLEALLREVKTRAFHED